MVKLNKEEKRKMCAELTSNLPKIRELLNVSQGDLGDMCGFSRTRVSQIETGAVPMTWSQFTSILFVCAANVRTKEFLYANRLFGPRILQFVQRKEPNIPPDTNIVVRSDLIFTYQEFMDFNKENK